METRSLRPEDFDQVHACMLDAFADYPIPMQPAKPAFASMVARRGVEWPLSLGGFVSGRLVAFTLTARSGALAYDVMSGVVRDQQGRGAIRRLFDELAPRLEREGIESMQLEVITTNERALRAYEALGLSRTRRLICVRWDRVEARAVDGFTIVESVLDWSRWAGWAEFEPAWPSRRETIERSEDRVVLEARAGDRAIGYLIGCGSDLLQIAVAATHRRRGVGTALVRAWNPGPARMLNLDAAAEGSLAWTRALGAAPFIEQWEMTCEVGQIGRRGSPAMNPRGGTDHT